MSFDFKKPSRRFFSVPYKLLCEAISTFLHRNSITSLWANVCDIDIAKISQIEAESKYVPLANGLNF